MNKTKGELARLVAAYSGTSPAGSVKRLTTAQLQSIMNDVEMFATRLSSNTTRLGYKLSDPGPNHDEGPKADDEHGLPDWSIQAFALLCTEMYLLNRGREITPTLARQISDARHDISYGTRKRVARKTGGILPAGAGNTRGTIYGSKYLHDDKSDVTTREGEDLLKD